MAASLSQPEEEEKLQPGLEPKVPGEQGPEEEHQQEEAHQQEEERQKEHRAHAPRALLSARKKKAGLVSPEGNTRTTYLLSTIEYLRSRVIKRADRVFETMRT